MKLDYEAVSRELVRTLRGSRSQVAFSRRLGYATNTIYSWEAGRRWPTAARFLTAAVRVGVDLGGVFEGFYRRRPSWLQDVNLTEPAGVVAFLRDLRGVTAIGVIAERTGRSRFAVSRWMSGGAQPRLPDFLRLVQATSGRVLDLVAGFAEPSTLKSTARAWKQQEAARELAWRSPWAQVVLLSLELASYRALPSHDASWLAGRLGLDASTVHGAMEQLRDAGHVRFTGTHYRPVQVLNIDVRRAGSGTALKRHWAQVGLDRLGGAGMHTYNIFTVSEAEMVELRDLQRAHYRAVRGVVERSTKPERVVLMNLQLLALDG